MSFVYNLCITVSSHIVAHWLFSQTMKET